RYRARRDAGIIYAVVATVGTWDGNPQPPRLAAPRGSQSGRGLRQKRVSPQWHAAAADDERRAIARADASGNPGARRGLQPNTWGAWGIIHVGPRNSDVSLCPGLRDRPDRQHPGH